MRRLIISFLFLLNLCVTIDDCCMLRIVSSELKAQHMELEGGKYDCLDDVVGWYRSPIPCDGPIITPDNDYAICTYCHEQFYAKDIIDHEYNCPARKKQEEDPWGTNGNNGLPSGGGGGGSGNGGGTGGSPNGNGSGKGDGQNGDNSDGTTHYGSFIGSNTTNGIKLNVNENTPIKMDAAACAGIAYQNILDDDYNKFKSHLAGINIQESTTLQQICKENGFSLNNYESGFKCTILERRDSSGKVVSYICSFAGTDTDISELRQVLNDVSNDIWNYFGIMPAQYYRAQQLAVFLKDYCDRQGVSLSFVGHSLGGGLAAMASIVTGCDAITFNAASVYCERFPIMEWLGIKESDTSHIYAYVMDGEFLSMIQTADGTIIAIPNSKGKNPFDAHAIDYMFQTLILIY